MTTFESKKVLGWSLWIATIATIFIYAFLLVYFSFLSESKIVGFFSPSILLLAVSMAVEIVVLLGSILLRKSKMRSFMKRFASEDANALGLALASSTTLWVGFDTTPELKELLEKAQLKSYLIVWIGADLVAIFGLLFALAQRNIFYFLPALIISLASLFLFRPSFDILRQKGL